MPTKPPAHNAQQIKERKLQYERQRGSARERGYTARWDRYSKQRLDKHPLCVRCRAKGSVVQAKVTDHIKPARVCTNEEFWSPANHQSLCTACNRTKVDEDAKLWA